MCGCNKNKEFVFVWQDVEYRFDTHAQASAERRRLKASNAPIRPRPKVTA